ncbi:MAG: polyprenyl synthetase family protein, partial [Legionellales bacterium]|nr:polyprenyl synthetase family protein [Legionellales bacterium]
LKNTPQADSKLLESMSYTCLNKGKRVRPILVYLFAEFLNIPLEKVDNIAAAIELIHCYSMIHDDLPAMDDDDFRRGKPSLHIAYNEGIAILAGDALQSLAFEVLAKNPYLSPKVKIQQTILLAQSCGWTGMAAGQLLDLESANEKISLDELEKIHTLKTGNLFMSIALMVGEILEKADQRIQAIIEYTESISFAFQIKDDILDIESTSDILGKPAKSDIKNNKNTYCSLLGIEKAKQKANELYNHSVNVISPWSEKTGNLELFAKYLLHRGH